MPIEIDSDISDSNSTPSQKERDLNSHQNPLTKLNLDVLHRVS